MASALVQVTAFSPCSQLSENIIMLGMGPSLESFPHIRSEGGKRSHSDIEEEQDKSHVKKRRKQSKPIRIASADSISDSKSSDQPNSQDISNLEFSETGEHFLANTVAEENTESLSPREDVHNSELNKGQENAVEEHCQKERNRTENYNVTLPLNLSNIKPQCDSLMESLIASQVNESLNRTKQQLTLESCASSFQVLSPEGSQSRKHIGLESSSYLSQSPSPLLLPLLKQNQMHNSASQLGSPIRIFNPEAFCDLCNKEFCNKYFLKTHKANKHGIYLESTSGPTLLDPLPSLPFINYFSNSSETFENTQGYYGSKHLFCQSTYPSSRSTSKKSIIPQQNNLFSLKPNVNGNMRAFCNICQREFCNKYFVRRHKAKIHGIIDPNSKDGTSSDVQDWKNQGNVNFNNHHEKFDVSSNETEFYLNFTNPFTSQFPTNEKETVENTHFIPEKAAVKQEKDMENGTDVSSDLPLSTPLSSSANSSLFQNSQNEDYNKENALSPGRLKKLGIVNTDAFCDICCKEYCNKYFLRTHKLKSHGIISTDVEKKEDKVNGSAGNHFWYQSQTTPLNLIVSDQSTNRESIGKVPFDTESDDTVCNVCGHYFQNQFLLKMHHSYYHSSSNKYSTRELQPTTDQFYPQSESVCSKEAIEYDPSTKGSQIPNDKQPNEPLKETEEAGSSRGCVSMEQAQKLYSMLVRLHIGSEITVCDVCNEDIRQTSSLENHLLKYHAPLMEEIGSIPEEENSNSQNSMTVTAFSEKKECRLCQKVFFNASLLEVHINECHNDGDLSLEAAALKASKEMSNSLKMSPVPSVTSSQSDRQGLQTPTNSFCEICKKELCNKYFMKTHMQRMHGISIENGAHIGGVVCDICNKELCSKYFLRVHKQNSHGIIDEVFLPQLGLDTLHNQSLSADPALKPSEQADLNHRYFTHFTEVCVICSRRFRSTKWLKAHLLNDHGEEGKEKWKEYQTQLEVKPQLFDDNVKEIPKKADIPVSTMITNMSSNNSFSAGNYNSAAMELETSTRSSGQTGKVMFNNTMFSMLLNGKDSNAKQYYCPYCPFSTSILAFFFVHERSHFQSEQEQVFQCPICTQSLDSKDNFEKHIKSHKIAGMFPLAGDVQNSNQEIPKGIVNDAKSESTAANDREFLKEMDKGNININHSDDSIKLSERQGTSTNHCMMSSQLNCKTHDTDDSMLHCTKCDFTSNSVGIYTDHINSHNQLDLELIGSLEKVKEALTTLASKAEIPALFAVPQAQGQFTMQPFVLEDSGDLNSSLDSTLGKAFLSSLVFLPVKEKLKKPVTASFKLTPT